MARPLFPFFFGVSATPKKNGKKRSGHARLGWRAIAIAMPSKLHLEITTFNKTKQMKH